MTKRDIWRVRILWVLAGGWLAILGFVVVCQANLLEPLMVLLEGPVGFLGNGAHDAFGGLALGAVVVTQVAPAVGLEAIGVGSPLIEPSRPREAYGFPYLRPLGAAALYGLPTFAVGAPFMRRRFNDKLQKTGGKPPAAE